MEGSSWKPSVAIYQGTGFSPYLKTAILSNAASILVLHNHPSGQATPSPEDIDVTKRLAKACDLMENTRGQVLCVVHFKKSIREYFSKKPL